MITISIDLQMADSDVQEILEAQCKLLCQSDSFKVAFGAHVESKDVVTIPST